MSLFIVTPYDGACSKSASSNGTFELAQEKRTHIKGDQRRSIIPQASIGQAVLPEPLLFADM